MGTNNKTQVQFVISHLEGCAGNFLAYLAAHETCVERDLFRVDVALNGRVLSIDGRDRWHQELDQRLDHHSVIVTHNFQKDLLSHTFPAAKILQIYPYTRIGNVLYNICVKKLDIKIANRVDNHLINLREWYKKLQDARPSHLCYDFSLLYNLGEVERMLDAELTESQINFFDRYWQQQLGYCLDLPAQEMSVSQIIKFYKLKDFCNHWSVAWVIFVFELCNHLDEADRLWSIDNQFLLQDWKNLCQIGNLYRSDIQHNRTML